MVAKMARMQKIGTKSQVSKWDSSFCLIYLHVYGRFLTLIFSNHMLTCK